MTTPQSLNEWLALLEQRHPSAIDLGLGRIGAVAQAAGIGRPAPRVVTVAGTNGKGSCVATIAAILRAAGLRVGVYTSPHFVRYNERIHLPDGLADDEAICSAFARIEQFRGDISLTYFEFGTLAAFDLMARSHCDVAVLEVGLGGRLDAVNLVDADVSVITSIELDHQEWLGNDRGAIGVEKAGIARSGRPVLVADAEPPTAMLDALAKLGAVIYRLGRDFGLSVDDVPVFPVDDTLLEPRLFDRQGRAVAVPALDAPSLPLPSILCGLQAALLLDDDGLVASRLAQGVPAVPLPGRWQRVSWRGREVVLDVAHNPAAARLLAQRLAREAGASHGVCAIMADKDLPAILKPLATILESLWVASIPDSQRAAPAATLVEAATQAGLVAEPCEGVENAFAAALACSAPGERIVVFGSFLTVGVVLRLMAVEMREKE